MLVLSHIQAQELLAARARGAAGLDISCDLGLSRKSLQFEIQGARLPDGVCLSWEALAAVAADENGCYLFQPPDQNSSLFARLPFPRLGEGELSYFYKIQLYSELTDRSYSLYPTTGAPTMLVSGLPMHRIKGTDPHRDTLEKIRAARPAGNVLDTCTGLGYTAIEASQSPNVMHVTTIELDPAALQICRANPWSQALFDNPKITQLTGDSFEVIEDFPDGAFSRILHDPPYFSLAGDLYSLEFYRQAWRVLSQNGHLFHYIGDPESKSGRTATAGVIRRLEQAGFRRVERAPRAFGVVARKGL